VLWAPIEPVSVEVEVEFAVLGKGTSETTDMSLGDTLASLFDVRVDTLSVFRPQGPTFSYPYS
jgi:hypothetical protein